MLPCKVCTLRTLTKLLHTSSLVAANLSQLLQSCCELRAKLFWTMSEVVLQTSSNGVLNVQWIHHYSRSSSIFCNSSFFCSVHILQNLHQVGSAAACWVSWVGIIVVTLEELLLQVQACCIVYLGLSLLNMARCETNDRHFPFFLCSLSFSGLSSLLVYLQPHLSCAHWLSLSGNLFLPPSHTYFLLLISRMLCTLASLLPWIIFVVMLDPQLVNPWHWAFKKIFTYECAWGGLPVALFWSLATQCIL